MKNYEELFDDHAKIEAFDKIASHYYDRNFGTMPKAELDLLLFSIYLERILSSSESDMNTYSDYTLSKSLGITQSRVSTLKEKKQLKYPHEFKWKEALARISKNVRYENGKFKLHIPDRNLFLELRNVIEELGGYVDVQLNAKLLQISPEYFVALMVEALEDEDRKKVRSQIRKEIRSHDGDEAYFEKKPLGQVLKEEGKNMALDLIKGDIWSGAAGAVKAIIASFSAAIE